jgi:ubiquinone/menaquinone biosynthesis C-methylase UbiE
MDAERLGCRDGFFEVATSIEVIEHLPDPERYLAELRRVLDPDGLLVLSTPNKRISSPTPGSLWPHHVREFHLHELHDLLAAHFSRVEMWGLSIPVYDRHPVRRLVHALAPAVKPILPLRLRTRLLPTLQGMIKPNLTLDDIQISQHDVEKAPTLMAVCRA